MATDEWLTFGGRELVNLSRTAQLAEVMGVDILWTDPSSVQWVEDALGGAEYDDITEAPWYEEGVPESAEFAGLVVLSMSGLGDSTKESQTIEYVTNGGSSGRARNKTLPIVVSMAVLGSTERGAEYGRRWLDYVLAGAGAQQFCSGSVLEFFRTEDENSPKDHYRDVTLSRGVSVTRKRVSDCAALLTVTFTLTANDPFLYGETVPVFTNLGSSYVLGADSTFKVNLLPNPAFETGLASWIYTTTSGSLTRITSGVNGYVASFVATATTTQWVSATAVSVSPNRTYQGSLYLKMQVTPVDYNLVLLWFDETGNFISSTSETIPYTALSGGEFRRISVSGMSPGNAASVRLQVQPVTSLPVGSGFQIDWAMIQQSTVLEPYFDGSTPSEPHVIYRWQDVDNPNATPSQRIYSPTLVNTGQTEQTVVSCPVYDYTPIYDPLHPALVAPPSIPDFYPAGWDLPDGRAYRRFWASISPILPSSQNLVPEVTLRSTSEARMIRVSVWPGDAEPDCDPMWRSIITYLPPNLDFVIDGEQQAAYAWDGASARVRRTDSLVFGDEARPLDWASFNDASGYYVALDVMYQNGSTTVLEGNGSVRMDLALVPKSN